MKLDIMNRETGEIIENGRDVIESIQRKEYVNNAKKIDYLLENNPKELTLEDLEFYMNKNKIKKDKISSFTSYHQTNDNYEIKLFETGISMKSYYYFKFLIANYCTKCYTLRFKNNRNMTKDVQISDKIGISERQWRDIKSELMKLNLLRVINFEKNKYYKVNPCYVGKQKTITPHTYDAFRGELIKHKALSYTQILYWDKFMAEEYLIDYAEIPHKN